MTNQDQSCLRFSLEESVWFQKGQEVDELISISLDPHITIEEQEQFIILRGVLELSGEYQPVGDGDLEDPHLSKVKYVQRVDWREDGECEFFHEFPIDVTIPKNRVQNIEEIDIFIDVFDYELPENACLRLNVDMSITGIYGEQQVEEDIENIVDTDEVEEVWDDFEEIEVVERVEQIEEDDEEDLDVFVEIDEDSESNTITPITEEEVEEGSQTFSAVARRRNVEIDNEEEEEKKIEVISRLHKIEKNQEEQVEIQEEVDEEIEENRLDQEMTIKFKSEDPTSREKQQVVDLSDQFVGNEKKAVRAEEDPIEEDLEAFDPTMEELTEEEYMESSSVEVIKNKKKGKKKKFESISLADFFARKEEESSSKLKVCIVQQGDTIDSLAERYAVSSHQIISENHLELTENLSEGQVLYIPATFKLKN
ncbi:stage VI sporulation protein D [Oikeobacillus pervagus]|uniref:Stage VI sporulation protein D n=1 Tax=Oikeobacillus pervagus TaxID=1325931 RepID=A0AAJ1WKF6_9BACI|nr:LysM peptidoglycan-binding domain-containing protein [Oikeobacillus pervagus]MDQ0216468.1 stage VI sporulation protein D [Oikeobacillus pervagus]